jgi:hypothetical protein
MGQQFDAIDDRRRAFIEAQHLYFVGTAAAHGRVNVSPKGLDTLRVLGPNRVVWLNLTGSGNESAAHLLENPRMTVMFCSFDREPLILRLYGTAREVQPDSPDWTELYGLFEPHVGARQIFVVDVELVQTSCGYAVPYMSFDQDRPMLDDWTDKKGPDGIADYWQQKNVLSIDGMPTGLRGTHTDG